MKIRESGMPEADAWDSYFEPDVILRKLGLSASCGDIVEFGCGYGTFTIPAARRVAGTVHTLDIEPSMIAIAKSRAEEHGLRNIEFTVRDFISEGTGLPTGSMDYAMVFNILHHEEPVSLLREAYRNLRDGGLIGIIQWVHDPETPRGPPMSIRPRPEQCALWAVEAGFSPSSGIIALPPYHYGMVLRRDETSPPANE
ncbi:MAG: class I SAM-dependent methyltransferase [Gammaproteobacteria bacterium]|nr:class I SAM-dependent methyltransferase [Gammaproteobacteria bacterium]